MKRVLFIYTSIFLLSACAGNKGTLPSFNILMADSATVFNTKDIPEGKPSVLIFFSPDCEHCQAETEGILKNMDSLKNAQFYFVTIDPINRMKVFNGYYKLFKYSNIVVGRDYSFFIPKYFKDAAPPYSVIYDRNKQQRYTFKGVATSRQLIACINQL